MTLLRWGGIGQCRVWTVTAAITSLEIQLPAYPQPESRTFARSDIAQFFIKALNVSVLQPSAWANEVRMHFVPVGLQLQRFGSELRFVVYID